MYSDAGAKAMLPMRLKVCHTARNQFRRDNKEILKYFVHF